MDSEPKIDNRRPPQSSDCSGVAFTSASPLEGFIYGQSTITSSTLCKSDSLMCDMKQPNLSLANPSRTTLISQHFNSPPVTLLVGGFSSPSTTKHEKAIYVHADLLTSVSPFFGAAFGTNSTHTSTNAGWSFTESRTRTMRLPEERPEDVDFLMQWIYWRSHHQKIIQKSSGSGILPAGGLWHEEIDPRVQEWHEFTEARRLLRKTLGVDHENVKQLKRPKPPAFGPLIRLYILADKFDVSELKSELCRRIREVGSEAKTVPGREDVELLWDSVMEDADGGLKNAVVEMYAGLGPGSIKRVVAADDEDEEWHSQFMADLILRMFARCENLKGMNSEGDGHGKGLARKVVSLAVR